MRDERRDLTQGYMKKRVDSARFTWDCQACKSLKWAADGSSVKDVKAKINEYLDQKYCTNFPLTPLNQIKNIYIFK